MRYSSAYVGSRLIWGTYQSYIVISLLFGPKADPSVGNLKFIYGGINIMLNMLNFFWFRSMVLALKKRYVFWSLVPLIVLTLVDCLPLDSILRAAKRLFRLTVNSTGARTRRRRSRRLYHLLLFFSEIILITW